MSVSLRIVCDAFVDAGGHYFDDSDGLFETGAPPEATCCVAVVPPAAPWLWLRKGVTDAQAVNIHLWALESLARLADREGLVFGWQRRVDSGVQMWGRDGPTGTRRCPPLGVAQRRPVLEVRVGALNEGETPTSK